MHRVARDACHRGWTQALTRSTRGHAHKPTTIPCAHRTKDDKTKSEPNRSHMRAWLTNGRCRTHVASPGPSDAYRYYYGHTRTAGGFVSFSETRPLRPETVVTARLLTVSPIPSTWYASGAVPHPRVAGFGDRFSGDVQEIWSVTLFAS